MREFKLKIQKFIAEHGDWEKILTQLPYGIGIQRAKFAGRNLMLLKYNQLESDFSLDVVKECRGIVLDEDTLEPVVVPFFKFFNYGEPHAASIDWKSANVTEKIDGSICKIVKLGGKLLIGTNGTIIADECDLPENVNRRFDTFGQLIRHTLAQQIPGYEDEWFLSRLQEGWTYMFELTSPDNRVVVPHTEDRLTFIGCRNNETLQETLIYDHPLAAVFPTPKRFSFSSFDSVLESTQKLPWDQEGYVVVDSGFNRVKVKSAAYVMVHHIRGNDGTVSPRRMLKLILSNECDEFLSYYPEFKPNVEKMKGQLESKVAELQSLYDEMVSLGDRLPTRKDKAQWILARTKTSGCLFSMLDGNSATAREWLLGRPIDDILAAIGAR